MNIKAPIVASAVAFCVPLAAMSQDNMKKLENFQSTGANLNMETVPQTGAKAEAIGTT
jgi:hypothetical protein